MVQVATCCLEDATAQYRRDGDDANSCSFVDLFVSASYKDYCIF